MGYNKTFTSDCSRIGPLFFMRCDIPLYRFEIMKKRASVRRLELSTVESLFGALPANVQNQIPPYVCKNSKQNLKYNREQSFFIDSDHVGNSLQPHSLLNLSFFSLISSEYFEKMSCIEILFLISIFANSSLYLHNVQDEISPLLYDIIHPSVYLVELYINKLLCPIRFSSHATLNAVHEQGSFDMLCIKCFTGVTNPECIEKAQTNNVNILIENNDFCYVCNVLSCDFLRTVVCKNNMSINAHFCE